MEKSTLDIQAVEQTALTWPQRAGTLTVADQTTYDEATTWLKQIAAVEKDIRAHYKPLKEAAQDSHKKLVAAEKQFLDPLTQAKGIINQAVTKYSIEQERKRRELENKARAEQRANEEANRIKVAIEADQNGAAPAVVDAILDTVPKLSTITQGDTYRKAEGVSIRTNWRAQVNNMKTLCAAVAEGKVSLEAVEPNQTWLNAEARKYHEALSIPGVVAVDESTTVVRS